MIRCIKTIEEGKKYRINNLNGVWCLISDLSQIQNANRILEFFFRTDNCYLIIEFVDEESNKEFEKNHDVLFNKKEKVCVTVSVSDLQNVVSELMKSTWDSDEKKISSVFLVDTECDVYTIKELIEKNKDIQGCVKKSITSFYIDVDDPFRVVCTFDIDKYSSVISKNFLGQHFIKLPFELN